jgi:hypothetical protein
VSHLCVRDIHNVSNLEEGQFSSGSKEEDKPVDLDQESESNLSSSDEADTLQPTHPAETLQSIPPPTHWTINNLLICLPLTLNTLLVVPYLYLSVTQLLSTLTYTSNLMSPFQLYTSTIIYTQPYSTLSTQIIHPKHIPLEDTLTVGRLPPKLTSYFSLLISHSPILSLHIPLSILFTPRILLYPPI